jgi:subtilisin family serine protease
MILRHKIWLILFLTLIARPAHAVYTGDIRVLLDDRKGNSAPETSFSYGVPVKVSWGVNIQDRWNKEKDPDLTFTSEGPSYGILDAPKQVVRYIQWTAGLLGAAGFIERIRETEYLDYLYNEYMYEQENPYCRFYNMVDDYHVGFLTRTEFNKLADELAYNWGRGPWDDPSYYTYDIFDYLSSSLEGPRYIYRGVITGLDHVRYDFARVITDQDGGGSMIGNPVTRGTLFYNYGSYSMPTDMPILEGNNSVRLSHWKFDQWTISGNALTGPGLIKDDGWKETSYSKIGDWGLSTGISYKFDVGLSYKLDNNYFVEKNPEFTAAVTPNDPLFASTGSWGQQYGDQWALQRIGFKPLEDPTSAWRLTTGTERPVVVAVIDSGIDLTHPDLHIDNIWKNPKETPGNALDDDNNGYIDDLIGWNFVQNDNNPFDLVGHGTIVAGLIAARWNNGRGIAGINRGARIMPLKVLNEIGKGWGSDIARALVYAVDNGAKIINISAEHTGQTKFLERAFGYAQEKGALVVVSAGNEAADTKGIEPANQPGVLVVAATLPNDKRVGFSNWGEKVNIAAPGVDVLSLRAHGTDLVRKVSTDPAKNKPREAVVGKDEQYYRASGTSFAAPLVTGVASLMLAKNPSLTAVQIKRMLMMSADDIETPGWDQLTGYGMVNARKALEADPNYYLYAELHRIAPAREGGRTVIQVFGTAMGSDWGDYRLEVGQGENPTSWKPAGKAAGGQVKENLLGTLTQGDFGGSGRWTVRLVALDKKGLTRESRSSITLQ